LPLLLIDFGQRCAYSLVHVRTISTTGMHVDHFDPRKKRRSPYTNLFPAYGICNMAKGDEWPEANDKSLGMRFLNPCEESDYNNVIFEEPKSNELVGITPAARYHIDILDLNNPALVHQRKERTALMAIAEKMVSSKAKTLQDPHSALSIVRKIREILHTKIPPIKPPPIGRHHTAQVDDS
jgi:hypothetical protein